MTLLSSKMIMWLIAIPALFIALLFGSFVAQETYIPILAFAVISILFVIYFTFGKRLWMLIPIGLALPFTANFLPLNFAYSELITGLAIALFVLQYQAIEKRGLHFGPAYIWIPLFAVIFILVVHMLSGGVGFRVLGSSGYGARKYLPAFFGLAAYILILTSPSRDWKTLNRIPLYFLIASLVGVLPSLATLAFPSLTPYVFHLFGSANISAYYISTGQSSDTQLVRYGEFATFGTGLFLGLVAYFPVHTWWRPQRWWVLTLAIFSVGLIFFSGFRSNVFNLIIIGAVASSLSLGMVRTMILGIPAIAVLLLVAGGHNLLYKLPYTVQRTLSMLPGDWDSDVIHDSKTSNTFRDEVQEIYMDRYVDLTLFGHGFKFDPNAADGSMLTPEQPTVETFVIKKDFHVGWISLYDGIGIIGTILVLWIMISIFRICFKLSQFERYRNAPIFVWLFSYLSSIFISYFAVFGSLPTLLSQIGIFGAILLSLLPKYNEQLSFLELTENPKSTSEGTHQKFS